MIEAVIFFLAYVLLMVILYNGTKPAQKPALIRVVVFFGVLYWVFVAFLFIFWEDISQQMLMQALCSQPSMDCN